MKIRKLDGLHDWTFGAGKQNYAVDEIAVEENIQTRVLSWQGDCFFALQEGIDWRNLLDKNQQENIELAVAEMILPPPFRPARLRPVGCMWNAACTIITRKRRRGKP